MCHKSHRPRIQHNQITGHVCVTKVTDRPRMCHTSHRPRMCHTSHRPRMCHTSHRPRMCHTSHRPRMYTIKSQATYVSHKSQATYVHVIQPQPAIHTHISAAACGQQDTTVSHRVQWPVQILGRCLAMGMLVAGTCNATTQDFAPPSHSRRWTAHLCPRTRQHYMHPCSDARATVLPTGPGGSYYL
jgi:hypothetical protein